MNGQKLETVTSFKYLGSVITDEGSKPEILSRMAQTTAALTRLKPVWNNRVWTPTAEIQRRIQAMEMRCYRKILHISYKDHFTNERVRAKIQQAIGPHEDLIMIIKRSKLQQYGHVSCSSGLAKIILQCTVEEGREEDNVYR